MMIHFAVIGTNWITKQFIDAAHLTGKFKLVAVYSRNKETAISFAKEYKITTYFTSLDELAQSSQIEAVYIASPNSYHYPQTKLLLQQGKHVICEKPFTSNYQQAKTLIEISKKNNVIFLEAFKTAYLPNFLIIQQYLTKIGGLRKAVFNYCQYSSRYQRYLNGETPNTFDPQFSNGSIMDIGFYCVAFAAQLWGKPQSVMASATLLKSGVDAHGSVILNYGDYDAIILHSKVSNSNLDSEIQGEDGTIVIQHLSNCDKVLWTPRNGVTEVCSITQEENTMYYEAEHFAGLIARKEIDTQNLTRSLITAELLTEIRHQTGVIFPEDQNSTH